MRGQSPVTRVSSTTGISPGLLPPKGMISFCICSLNHDEYFTIAWTLGALIVLWCQIIAVGMPPVATGSQRIILIGPAAVVLAVLPVDFLVLWLLIRRRSTTDTTIRGKLQRLFRLIGVATTGLLGSLLTVFVATGFANLTIGHIAGFSN